MDDKIPCCQLDVARRVKQIEIDGTKVGISHLDKIFEDITKLSLKTDKQIKKELLTQVKIYNYIPQSAESAYMEAIFEVYKCYLETGKI